jgi:hypothetical protein
VTVTSFSKTKQLRVTLTLGAPVAVFPQTGDNTLVLTNMRIVTRVQAVVRFATQLDLSIYGMRQPDMNALTVLFFGPTPNQQLNNTVLLEASNGTTWTQVFFGTIVEGSPRYCDMPNVSFHIQARFGYFSGLQVGAPLSYPQGVSVSQAVQTIANRMNLQLENNGVTAMLSAGSYFPGSSWQQLREICGAADVDYYTEGTTLIICPKGAPRQNQTIVTLSPENGLIAEPRIEVGGIGIDCLYSPLIAAGSLIQVAGTSIPAANGTWLPYAAMHELESWQPQGAWQTSIHALWQAPT